MKIFADWSASAWCARIIDAQRLGLLYAVACYVAAGLSREEAVRLIVAANGDQGDLVLGWLLEAELPAIDTELLA